MYFKINCLHNINHHRHLLKLVPRTDISLKIMTINWPTHCEIGATIAQFPQVER